MRLVLFSRSWKGVHWARGRVSRQEREREREREIEESALLVCSARGLSFRTIHVKVRHLAIANVALASSNPQSERHFSTVRIPVCWLWWLLLLLLAWLPQRVVWRRCEGGHVRHAIEGVGGKMPLVRRRRRGSQGYSQNTGPCPATQWTCFRCWEH